MHPPQEEEDYADDWKPARKAPRMFSPAATRIVIAVWCVLLLFLRFWNKSKFSDAMSELQQKTHSEYQNLLDEANELESHWETVTGELQAQVNELGTVLGEALQRFRREMHNLDLDVEMSRIGKIVGDFEELEANRKFIAQQRNLRDVKEGGCLGQQFSGKGGSSESSSADKVEEGEGGTGRHVLSLNRKTKDKAELLQTNTPNLDIAVHGVDSQNELEAKLAKLVKASGRQQSGGHEGASQQEMKFFRDEAGHSPQERERVAVAREVSHMVLSAYMELYHVAQLQDRVTRYREVFAPFIKAIEARKDRMLYNYI